MTGAGRRPRAAVRAAVRAALADLDPGDRVLVALSGGPDSLALLAATVVVAADQGWVCGAVVVDHGLQERSGAVAARAAEQARLLGCSDARVVRIEVPGGPGAGGLEAAAREARYAALQRAARGPATPIAPSTSRMRGATHERRSEVPAAAVLLGHTRDDQAETVLLGLSRGSGTRSLAGMAPRAGLFRRPLLGLPRAVVVAASAEAAATDPRLQPWTDPHNADPAFARVRVRQEVLPVLDRALGPRVAEALARTADLARQDADALDAWAERVWAGLDVRTPRAPGGLDVPGGAPVGVAVPTGGFGALPVEQLRGTAPDPLPAAIATRVVRRFLVEAGCPAGALTAAHVSAVAHLLDGPHGRAEVALPGGLRARREGGTLVVRA